MSENNAMCDMYQNLFDMAKEGNFDEFCAAIDQFADGVQNQDFRKPPKFKVGDYVTVPPDTHLTRHIGRVYTVLGVLFIFIDFIIIHKFNLNKYNKNNGYMRYIGINDNRDS